MEYVGWQSETSLHRYLAGIDRGILRQDLRRQGLGPTDKPIQQALQEVFSRYKDPDIIGIFEKWRTICGSGNQRGLSMACKRQPEIYSPTETPQVMIVHSDTKRKNVSKRETKCKKGGVKPFKIKYISRVMCLRRR